MQTFLSWLTSHEAGKDKRVTYALGPEARLRDLIVRTLKKETTDRITVWADGTNDDQVWAELFTHPLRQTQIKLVTVREAHQIRDWTPLQSWLNEMKTVKAIMEADKPLFSVPMQRGQKKCVRGHQAPVNVQVYKSGKEKRTCSLCDAAEKLLSSRGRLVLCAPPTTDASRRDAAHMICNLTNASEGQARYLLNKTNWRIDAAFELVEKIKLLGAPLTEDIINALGMSVDDTQYELAMREGDRARAVTTAPYIHHEDISRVLDRLENWLTNVARTERCLRVNSSTSEIVKALGVDWGYAIAISNWAARFNIKSVAKCTIALANAQRSWASGARIGVLEVLAANW